MRWVSKFLALSLTHSLSLKRLIFAERGGGREREEGGGTGGGGVFEVDLVFSFLSKAFITVTVCLDAFL